MNDDFRNAVDGLRGLKMLRDFRNQTLPVNVFLKFGNNLMFHSGFLLFCAYYTGIGDFFNSWVASRNEPVPGPAHLPLQPLLLPQRVFLHLLPQDKQLLLLIAELFRAVCTFQIVIG